MRRTEDPLAELARLIGQEDPFADFVAHRPADGRTGGHAGVQRRPAQARDVRPQDARALERRRTGAPLKSPDSLEVRDDPFGADDRHHADNRATYSYGGGRAPRAPELPAAPARGLRDERPGTARPLARTQDRVAPGLEDEEEIDFNQSRSARDTRSARRAPVEDGGYNEYAADDYDPEYDDDAYLPAHGDEFYDEAPRRRLKGWMLVGVAALGAIIVGTSGLFAYRALFGTDQAAMPAKVISPVAGPTKMVPGGDQSADNKRIQDRVGGEPARSAERIVPREENPIDQSRIPQGGTSDRIPGGGTVTAATPQFSPPPAAAAPAAQAPASTVAPANVSTEPRRVRTVTVRSDGSVVADPARAPASAAAPARPGTANPLALQGGQAALPPARPSGTTSSSPLQGDNPWSNLPGGGSQQAALPQSAPAVAVNTPAPAGSYVVQVAAQKSEAEAQATWQALQQRYGSVLAGQQAQIRRVDLGERGIFYRAQVGPFSSRAQASEVCQSLKAAGGECVIQRN